EFERAIQLNPKIPQAHSSLGRVLLQSGDRDRALPEFEAELKISPNDFHANLYAGFLRRRNDQDDEPLPHLLKAQQLRPGDASVAFQISLIHMNKGELNEAQRMLEEIVKQQPDLIDAHVTLARVYYKKKMKAEGDREQAIVEKLRAQLQKLQPGSQKSAEIKEEEKAGGKPQPAKPSKP